MRRSDLIEGMLMGKRYLSDRHPSSLLAIVFAVGLSAPALGAGDAYKEACAAYKKGDYADAKAQFLKVLKSQPANWQAEYQLANSCMQLRTYAEARKWYCSCLMHHPDASTGTYCQSAVGQIDQMANSQRNASASATAAQQDKMKSENATYNAEREKEDKSRSNQTLAAQKRVIMEQAQKKAEEVRKAGEARVQDAIANSNQRYRDPNTGEVKMDISPEERQAIMKDSDQQIQRIMEQAKRDCDALR